ncbi:MAG: hypothetical protein RR371_04060 [Bacteroides sp.]
MHYNKEIFSGLVDFMRINAPALGSSGLYQGKAGVALSLFAAENTNPFYDKIGDIISDNK